MCSIFVQTTSTSKNPSLRKNKRYVVVNSVESGSQPEQGRKVFVNQETDGEV